MIQEKNIVATAYFTFRDLQLEYDVSIAKNSINFYSVSIFYWLKDKIEDFNLLNQRNRSIANSVHFNVDANVIIERINSLAYIDDYRPELLRMMDFVSKITNNDKFSQWYERISILIN